MSATTTTYQENEDGVSVEAQIRPEDAMELGGAAGTFSLPPVVGMDDATATTFHAALNAWPKAKAKGKSRPPNAGAEVEHQKTPEEKLNDLIDHTEKEISFLDKVLRTCKHDPDAEHDLAKCADCKDRLTETQDHMRKAVRECLSQGSSLREEFWEWAQNAVDQDLKWIEKNKKILQLHLGNQQPKKPKAKKSAQPPQEGW